VGRFSRISRAAVTGSTNDDVAAILGQEQARGLVRIAEYQQHGTGRKGRAWVAPPKSALLCTLALPDALPAAQLWAVPFWAALVARRALERAGVPSLLQWPNDVLALDARKIAGILCISRVTGDYAWAGCGIGINVQRPADASAYEALESPPTFVSDLANVTVDDMLAHLMNAADELYDMLEHPARIAHEWERAANVPGARYCILKDESSEPFDAVAVRLLHDGSLLVDRGDEEVAVSLADARVLR
jgi:biotin-[acetyl-CoA-carboxylase] ligase BirA-like protein